jgi:hypothetical protein
LTLVALAAVRIVERSARAASYVAAAGIMIAGVVASAGVFLPQAGPAVGMLGPLFPRARVRPIQRTDLDEVRRLLGRLDELTAHRPGYIYVLGCTGTLSEQTLAFANWSLDTDFTSPRMILRSANVDRRDGFPSMLLEATYVVVPDPVQTNMRPEDQQVVVLPTMSFLQGRDIAGAFRRLPDVFELSDGVRVSVFEIVRPIGSQELGQLSDRLRRRYPDRPDIYLPRHTLDVGAEP